MAQKKIPPMMAHYIETKKQYPDCLLFYRLGDFYELFFEDAQTAAKALDLVLTYRGYLDDKPIPMCGVPFHAYENYLVRLVKAGYKVAICEQMESPQEAKKRGSTAIVKRDVIRIVTAGTLTEDSLLDARTNNYLMSIVPVSGEYALAWTDMSTGEFYTQVVSSENLGSNLIRLNAAEILISENFLVQHPYVLGADQDLLEQLPIQYFDFLNNQKELCEFFNISDAQVFHYLTRGEIIACGVIVNYLLQTQKGECPILFKPKKIETTDFMAIDASTRRSLEITLSGMGDKNGTLLKSVDFTVSSMGARVFAKQLGNPLMNIDLINGRLDKIDYFLQNVTTREKIRKILKDMPDIERSLARISVGRGGPKDIVALAQGLGAIPELRNCINDGIIPKSLQQDLEKLGDYSEIVTEVLSAFEDDPLKIPALARDGGFIRAGYYPPLDEIRSIKIQARKIISEMQTRYIQETNINALKITYNNVSGYSVEMPTKFAEEFLIHKEKGFIHKQTLTNCVRFTTPELSDWQMKIMHSDEQAVAMELELYEQIRLQITSFAESIQETCLALSHIDIAIGQAIGTEQYNWVRPILTKEPVFDVKGGRHPVVEAALSKERQTFIPNDCLMGEDAHRLWLLTGPNMAGKSTFLRQNALMAILAQTGCFVPATSAKIGLVDKLFSRVGASDDLARGRSTFMVEMVEVAAILNGATENSLVILDEVGRGTATFDGLSIAWAVVEHLHNINKCRGLFATHYHELTALTNRLDKVVLQTMRVKEWKGDIVFLHEVGPGAIDRSYGIHVGKLAGLPEVVLTRAEQILEQLEEKKQEQKPLFDDLPLFSQIVETTSKQKNNPVTEELKNLDVDSLSPREALDKLYQLKTLAEA
ncbi:MAG: DNA mismatch repair protein MutS [Alphaproteobacteria bacterium]|nr:DNA mismatch repair protein MutS [Alphaproteobacteria bacterium]